MQPSTDPCIILDSLGGNCPVQAEGTIDGKPFYFRARGEHWSIGIGGDPVSKPEWFYMESYGEDAFVAGWMTKYEALGFIAKSMELYAKGHPSE